MPLLSPLTPRLAPRRGIASLPVILLLGAVIVEVGVASMFLLSYLNSSVYGTRLNNQAFLAARAGINDAISRVILNKNCGADASCAPVYPDTYTITTAGATAEISICKDTCAGSGKHEIVATGFALTRRHRVAAILTVDAVTGLVSVDSIADEP